MLQRFPGRTLEELDGMDWPRYLRALAAERIEAIEYRRRMWMAKKLKAEDITPEDWEAIQEHDEWLNQT